MDTAKIKLIAFDLDGTLTQHKTPITAENRAVLDALSQKYTLVMTSAGMCHRIFNQLGKYPMDVIGSYGMQMGRYNPETGALDLVKSIQLPCDRESVDKRVTAIRETYGYTRYAGDNVEFHMSGCISLPLLGTQARQEDKLAFDPDKRKRRAICEAVRAAFPEYTVYLGGSSSFDMTPAPYTKYYALDGYSKALGLTHDQVAFVGDDYGPCGNDEPVYRSDFRFVKIDDYRTFPQVMKPFL